MIRIVIKNEKLYLRVNRLLFLNKFFVLKIYPVKINSFYVFKNIIDLKTADKPFHKTGGGRFSDVDDITIGWIKKNNIKRFHDLAVSSGITSCDLYKKIEDERVNLSFYISEKFSNYYFSGKHFLKIYNNEKKFIFGYVFCFLASGSVTNNFYVSKLLFKLLKICKSKKINQATIFDEEAINLLDKKKIKFFNYDIFNTKVDKKFDFVRCMNILNKSYFNEDELVKAIRNIRDSLKEGGIIQIGKGRSPNTSCSFYRKNGNNLILLEEVKGGIEIKGIVEDNFI